MYLETQSPETTGSGASLRSAIPCQQRGVLFIPSSEWILTPNLHGSHPFETLCLSGSCNEGSTGVPLIFILIY